MMLLGPCCADPKVKHIKIVLKTVRMDEAEADVECRAMLRLIRGQLAYKLFIGGQSDAGSLIKDL